MCMNIGIIDLKQTHKKETKNNDLEISFFRYCNPSLRIERCITSNRQIEFFFIFIAKEINDKAY